MISLICLMDMCAGPVFLFCACYIMGNLPLYMISYHFNKYTPDIYDLFEEWDLNESTQVVTFSKQRFIYYVIKCDQISIVYTLYESSSFY